MADTETREEKPSASEFFFSTFGFAVFQISTTVARLGVPDVLDGAPKTADEIAASLGVDAGFLARLLRAAAGVGMLRVLDDGRYDLTELGRVYRNNAAENARRMTDLHAAKPVWQAWGALEDAIRTGKPAFDCAHGVGFYEYIKTDTRLAEIFHDAMAASSESQLPVFVPRYDFGDAKSVVDVGGGSGLHLAAILAANEDLRGTVADTAVALRGTAAVFEKAGVADRGTGEPSDIFKAVPSGGDVYMLKNVLLDFDDESCEVLLRNCREAMSPQGKVMVVALPMPESPQEQGSAAGLVSAISDIGAMVTTTGKERTLAEYERLFASADLALGEVTYIESGSAFYRVIEALPAS
ncbi:methyltransferase [Amycolatopsis sp. NPDC059027]|uniref:methyltransferase n=1 Tax=unclassified Amycolatopsis TaxID=2618356 RepID=UPI0036707DDA